MAANAASPSVKGKIFSLVLLAYEFLGKTSTSKVRDITAPRLDALAEKGGTITNKQHEAAANQLVKDRVFAIAWRSVVRTFTSVLPVSDVL